MLPTSDAGPPSLLTRTVYELSCLASDAKIDANIEPVVNCQPPQAMLYPGFGMVQRAGGFLPLDGLADDGKHAH